MKMKMCQIYGDMSSDSASDQYPEVPICVDCIKQEAARGEDSIIIGVGEDVTDPDATCELCDCGMDD